MAKAQTCYKSHARPKLTDATAFPGYALARRWGGLDGSPHLLGVTSQPEPRRSIRSPRHLESIVDLSTARATPHGAVSATSRRLEQHSRYRAEKRGNPSLLRKPPSSKQTPPPHCRVSCSRGGILASRLVFLPGAWRASAAVFSTAAIASPHARSPASGRASSRSRRNTGREKPSSMRMIGRGRRSKFAGVLQVFAEASKCPGAGTFCHLATMPSLHRHNRPVMQA
jgi:hypothetical protein